MSISGVSSVASATAAAQLGQQAAPGGPATAGASSVHGKGRREHGEEGKAQIDKATTPGNSAVGSSGSAVDQIA